MRFVFTLVFYILSNGYRTGFISHKRALTNGDPWMSTLAEHAMNHQHDMVWEDLTVVNTDSHMY